MIEQAKNTNKLSIIESFFLRPEELRVSKKIVKAREEIRTIEQYGFDKNDPEAIDLAHQLRKQLAPIDFYSFVELFAPEVMPDSFKTGLHLVLYCHVLMESVENVKWGLENGVGDRQPKIQFQLPPGSMKSLILCLFIAWVFGKFPKWRVIHVGATADFAEANYGIRIKKVLSSELYRELFPETIISSQLNTRGMWTFTAGGEYRCTGAGVAVVGRRAEFTVLDDVISEQTAFSANERTKINKNYVPGIRSRLIRGIGGEIIVNTRWHLEDLSGYITQVDAKSKKPWKIIKIPALLDSYAVGLLKKVASLYKLDSSDIKEGGSFWPELWDYETLCDLRDTQPEPHYWSALYMQEPVNSKGTLFKKKYLTRRVLDRPPSCSFVVASFDTAFSTNEKADFSAITVWGVFTDTTTTLDGSPVTLNKAMLIHNEKDRFEFYELLEATKSIFHQYRPNVLLVEKKASGQSLIQELRRQGYPVVEYTPDRDKLTRAAMAQPYFKNGQILLWENEDGDNLLALDEYETELLQFAPGTGSKDDYVDSTSQAVLFMVDSYVLDPLYLADTQGTKKDIYGDDDDEKFDRASRSRRRRTYWK